MILNHIRKGVTELQLSQNYELHNKMKQSELAEAVGVTTQTMERKNEISRPH